MPGKVCLTFDDCYLDSWMAALPLLESHGARATFFVSYFPLSVDGVGLKMLQDTQARGHEIGCHSVSHHDPRKFLAVYTEAEYVRTEVHPTLRMMRACGLNCDSWAYPFNQSTPGLLRKLSAEFKVQRIRALEPDQALAKPGDTVLRGFTMDGIVPGGTPELRPIEPVLAVLDQAVATDRIAVLYGHDIVAQARRALAIQPDRLAAIMAHARNLGMEFVTASQIARM